MQELNFAEVNEVSGGRCGSRSYSRSRRSYSRSYGCRPRPSYCRPTPPSCEPTAPTTPTEPSNGY